uniref:Uncharacterized protein n=1 Tax=Glossina palpalis gambiensis TaxID=67801 RepID=A0A1B0BWK2_9MUSC
MTLEEYSHKLYYKPSKSNSVDNALSRPPQEVSGTCSTFVTNSNLTEKCSNNAFKNQVVIKPGETQLFEFHSEIIESNCLSNSIHSKPSNCTLISNTHLITVQDILPCTLILNPFNGTVLMGRQLYNLTVQSRVENPLIEGTLTLELIKETHLNNNKTIALLNIESKLRDICYTLTLFTISIILCLLLKKLKKSPKVDIPKDINVDIPFPNFLLLGQRLRTTVSLKGEELTKISSSFSFQCFPFSGRTLITLLIHRFVHKITLLQFCLQIP